MRKSIVLKKKNSRKVTIELVEKINYILEEIGYNLPEEVIKEHLHKFDGDEYRTIDYLLENKDTVLQQKKEKKETI